MSPILLTPYGFFVVFLNQRHECKETMEKNGSAQCQKQGCTLGSRREADERGKELEFGSEIACWFERNEAEGRRKKKGNGT